MTDLVSQEVRELSELIRQGAREELADYCQERLAGGTQNPYVYLAMAMLAFGNGDPGLSLQLLDRAHQIDPDCREVVDALASINTRFGRMTDGLYYGKLAVSLRPREGAELLVPAELSSYMAALLNVGLSAHALQSEAAFHLGMFAEALDQAEKHLRIHSDHVPSMLVAARSMLELGRCEAAVAMMRAALHHEPRSAWCHAVLAEALMETGYHERALGHQALAMELADGEDAAAFINGLVAKGLARQSSANWPEAKSFLARYHAWYAARFKPAPARRPLDENGLVGVMWDQVFDSPMVHCAAPVLRSLDNVVLYILNARHDHQGETLRAGVMRPRLSKGVDTQTLGRIVSGDFIRCMINLCSPDDGAHFPRFKGEGAPVNVHWINWPMTDRIPSADIVLSDPETDDIDRQSYGEGNVVALDHLLAFEFPQLLAPEEQVMALPKAERGFVTFGVHASLANIAAETVALWSRVLWAVPKAHLMIGGRTDWEEETVTGMLDRFAEYGLSDRIHLQQPLEGIDGSPSALFPHLVDIVLDSAPVSEGPALARDLWMGVPVVTLRGARRAGRVGASILRAAGRSEWIAGDEAEYVAIASRLAADGGLAAIRAGLRADVLASPLADTAALVKDLGAKLPQAVEIVEARRTS
jgi:predicted O-linked N-acetylglucosamine transferase (SPINDLY family)